ncbi:hypothetical protein E4U14_003464 [Claviceps sp. LM454 group G7]|nr:hypothetical protein E4U14_003464 [Claviceps sp. LM454 group G7]
MGSSDMSRQVGALAKSLIPPRAPVLPSWSVGYANPTTDLVISRTTQSTHPPVFRVVVGDPVMIAISNAMDDTASEADQAGSGGRVRVAFISAAYKWQPAGSHPADPPSYEQDLCNRSNLRETLTMSRTDEPHTYQYPISATGGIFSNNVLVHTGPRDKHEPIEPPRYLPVISVTPLRRPRATYNGARYSRIRDKVIMREKIRGALLICRYHNYDRVVIGDFGMGDVYHNPPQILAEIWRDLFLFDPVLRGHFAYVVFAFEDPTQSTRQWFREQRARRTQREYKRKHGVKSAMNYTTSKSTSRTAEWSHSLPRAPTDMAIFQSVFHRGEIERVLRTPNPRCSIAMMLS